jgi:tRNA-specific 2-thiouridylase
VIERLKPGAAEPGDIVDLAGNVLGAHAGIIHFTVGQRRGLGVAAGHPLYVVRLDAAARRVIVGPREALRTRAMRLREVNWLGEDTIDHALCAGWHEVFVKVRSTRPPQPAWLSRGAGGIEVDFVAGEDGVSPGQACVFYDAAQGQSRVLGGGFIASAVAAAQVMPARDVRVASGA